MQTYVQTSGTSLIGLLNSALFSKSIGCYIWFKTLTDDTYSVYVSDISNAKTDLEYIKTRYNIIAYVITLNTSKSVSIYSMGEVIVS